MAIPSYASSLIQASGATPDTFQSWINKTNTLFGDVATVVVTTDSTSSGATTTGNTHIEGILSGSTLVAGTALRGGTVATPAALTITSSTAINPGSSSTFTTNALTDVTLSGNVAISGAAKTLSVSTVTTTIAGTTTNLNSTNLAVGAGTTTTFSGTINANGNTNVANTAITTAAITTANVTDLTTTGTVHFNSVTSVELPTGTTAQRPSSPAIGSLRYNTSLGTFEGVNGSSVWSRLNGAYVASTAPSTPAEGDFWYDTSIDTIKVREGSNWMQATPITFTSTTATMSKNLTMTGNLSVTGAITATGDITAFSDRQLKENVLTIDGALGKIASMRGVYYNRIGEVGRKVGVIAQEVEAIVPELVIEQDNGLKSVAYGNALGLIIEAIKELKAEVEELKRG